MIKHELPFPTLRVCRVLLATALVLGALAVPGAFAQETIPAPPDVAAPPDDAEVTASGLASKVLEPGYGDEQPGLGSHVIVHYTGWTTDGKMFASSVTKKKHVSFEVQTVLPGLMEGFQLMKLGEKRRFWIPSELGYRDQADRPQGMLVFDVELFDFLSTPSDVAAPPADAVVEKSGLASKLLRPGSGTEHPKRSAKVTVHYSGWTLDGKMFDSSVLRGEPSSFRLTQVIRGWTLGVPLMVEGEKRRFWIPAKMAYRGVSNRPQGMLVFDIELVSIDR